MLWDLLVKHETKIGFLPQQLCQKMGMEQPVYREILKSMGKGLIERRPNLTTERLY